ncbi:hypothetical protein [Plantactinospora sp. KLBMP9567]|uniref:hypothetical protein n=1 Tax=Plantactinospora sp. KLBMP9567 TaxID=3085900 RepID=UPI0029823ACE|nr:hypothetical protein [Plantactinospora sp. KLBMP9567]MDW5328284.1 hypothetical protein [Plantactinospora sp. KLBMP9567]
MVAVTAGQRLDDGQRGIGQQTDRSDPGRRRPGRSTDLRRPASIAGRRWDHGQLFGQPPPVDLPPMLGERSGQRQHSKGDDSEPQWDPGFTVGDLPPADGRRPLTQGVGTDGEQQGAPDAPRTIRTTCRHPIRHSSTSTHSR